MEEYILNLYKNGFSTNQVKALTQLYKLGYDLSYLPKYIDDTQLRKAYFYLSNSKYSDSLKSVFQTCIKNKLNFLDFLDPKYSKDSYLYLKICLFNGGVPYSYLEKNNTIQELNILKEANTKGYDLSLFGDTEIPIDIRGFLLISLNQGYDLTDYYEFDHNQLVEIKSGLELGLSKEQINKYANKKYTSEKMYEIKLGLKNNIDIYYYLDDRLTAKQMHFIRLGLQDELNVLKYASLHYNEDQMETLYIILTNSDYQDVKMVFNSNFTCEQMLFLAGCISMNLDISDLCDKKYGLADMIYIKRYKELNQFDILTLDEFKNLPFLDKKAMITLIEKNQLDLLTKGQTNIYEVLKKNYYKSDYTKLEPISVEQINKNYDYLEASSLFRTKNNQYVYIVYDQEAELDSYLLDHIYNRQDFFTSWYQDNMEEIEDVIKNNFYIKNNNLYNNKNQMIQENCIDSFSKSNLFDMIMDYLKEDDFNENPYNILMQNFSTEEFDQISECYDEQLDDCYCFKTITDMCEFGIKHYKNDCLVSDILDYYHYNDDCLLVLKKSEFDDWSIEKMSNIFISYKDEIESYYDGDCYGCIIYDEDFNEIDEYWGFYGNNTSESIFYSIGLSKEDVSFLGTFESIDDYQNYLLFLEEQENNYSPILDDDFER